MNISSLIRALGLTTLTITLSSCSIDKGLKKEFRKSAWQSFSVTVSARASSVSKSKSFVINETSDQAVNRKSSWDGIIERALIEAGFEKAASSDKAALFIDYKVELKGSGAKDWIGSYTRQLKITAKNRAGGEVWATVADSSGTFDYPAGRLVAVLAAAGIDHYGRDDANESEEKVSEENPIVQRIYGVVAAESKKADG